MSFEPPRCPHLECEAHAKPRRGFSIRYGFFRARCRNEPEQRYQCKDCKRTFSRQTFRHDYRDRRPECNEELFRLLVSGVGLRQSGRWLKLGIHGVQRKMRKLAATCHRLHDNLSRRLPAGRTYVMDEEETYEGASIRPLTMPVLIDRDTWFVVASAVGPIRRLAAEGTARRKRQDAAEAKAGPRPDASQQCVRKVLEALDRRTEGKLELLTDEKPSYAKLAREVFADRVVHGTTSGEMCRGTFNPLFPINTTLAMTRDNCGRLRRKSWLVTKRARWLEAQMGIFAAYRNYVRRRFNRDPESDTPAKILGLRKRPLTADEVVRWRQDWGARSPEPTALLLSATPAAAIDATTEVGRAS